MIDYPSNFLQREATIPLERTELDKDPHGKEKTHCVKCGAGMSVFVWGVKNVDTCHNCGFKHPCCE